MLLMDGKSLNRTQDEQRKQSKTQEAVWGSATMSGTWRSLLMSAQLSNVKDKLDKLPVSAKLLKNCNGGANQSFAQHRELANCIEA